MNRVCVAKSWNAAPRGDWTSNFVSVPHKHRSFRRKVTVVINTRRGTNPGEEETESSPKEKLLNLKISWNQIFQNVFLMWHQSFFSCSSGPSLETFIICTFHQKVLGVLLTVFAHMLSSSVVMVMPKSSTRVKLQSAQPWHHRLHSHIKARLLDSWSEGRRFHSRRVTCVPHYCPLVCVSLWYMMYLLQHDSLLLFLIGMLSSPETSRLVVPQEIKAPWSWFLSQWIVSMVIHVGFVFDGLCLY